MMIIVKRNITSLTRIGIACWHERWWEVYKKMIKLSPWKYVQNRQSQTYPHHARCHVRRNWVSHWQGLPIISLGSDKNLNRPYFTVFIYSHFKCQHHLKNLEFWRKNWTFEVKPLKSENMPQNFHSNQSLFANQHVNTRSFKYDRGKDVGQRTNMSYMFQSVLQQLKSEHPYVGSSFRAG